MTSAPTRTNRRAGMASTTSETIASATSVMIVGRAETEYLLYLNGRMRL